MVWNMSAAKTPALFTGKVRLDLCLIDIRDPLPKIRVISCVISGTEMPKVGLRVPTRRRVRGFHEKVSLHQIVVGGG